MIRAEKDKLLSLFSNESRWCQHVEARDGQGDPVHYDDDTAAAWDIVGGLCHLFGWSRACKLFVPIARHLFGKNQRWTFQDRDMAAMRALQDFNDKQDTTCGEVVERLRELSVWLPRLAGSHAS